MDLRKEFLLLYEDFIDSAEVGKYEGIFKLASG